MTRSASRPLHERQPALPDARFPRFLVVKLADLGDVLTITPALRALRLSYPTAQIDALVTPVGAEALRGLDSVDNLISFRKTHFDRPTLALAPLLDAARLGLRLRGAAYSHVFLMHHLFTGFGRLKYASVLAATGAAFRGGVAEGHPPYLSHVVPDRGYGVQHEADYWLAVAGLAGARNPAPRFEIAVDAAAQARATALLGEREPGPAGRRVAFYPGSGSYSPARRWPVARYREVAQKLIAALGESRVEIVVVGSAEEAGLAETLCAGVGPRARNLAGCTDLKTLAAVLAGCDLLIGNDGGVMHLARAVGLPVVAIFGPTNAVSWGPYDGTAGSGERSAVRPAQVIRTDLPCSPCLYRGYLPGTPSGCPSRDCLQLISSDAVVTAARRLLNPGPG